MTSAPSQPPDVLQLRLAINASGEVIFLTDPRGVFTFVNPAFERLYGYAAEELVGRETPQILIGERVPPGEYTAIWQQLLKDQTVEANFLSRTKTGRLVNVEASLSPFRDESGAIAGVLAIGRDVTARRQIEEALQQERDRESQAQLQLISDNMLDLVSQVRLDGTFVWVSPSFQTVLGYEPREVVGTSAFALVHPDDLEQVLRILAEAVERRGAGRAEFRIRHADGSYLWLETVGKLLCDARGVPSGAILSGRDTTVRRQLEDQLRQAQKLEAVGSLAGGIAHDFNNLLTAIMGYADLALEEIDPMSPVHADLEEIARAGRSAEALTRQLLIFSRKSLPRLELIKLNDIVSRLENMLKRMSGEHIEFDVQLSPDLGPVKADPSELEQVLVNLVVNARDAMPAGGRLTIETRTIDSDGTIAGAPASPGVFTALVVTDNGCGMSPEVQARIFDPFFTTKGPEKGTGLGLATVQGIVQQAGGYLTVQSAPGAGSTFLAAFPLATDQSQGRAPDDDADTGPVAETVLVVEDNDTIRDVASRALERQGYTVLAGRSAAEVPAAHVGRSDGRSPHHGCGDAGHERTGAGRAAAREPPAAQGAVHIRLHRGHESAPGAATRRHAVPSEAVHDERACSDGSAGVGRDVTAVSSPARQRDSTATRPGWSETRPPPRARPRSTRACCRCARP